MLSRNLIFKNFGIALLLDSLAFAVWSVAVVINPVNLDQFVTVGAAFFIASLVFLFITSVQKTNSSTRGILIIFGVLVGVAMFCARTFLYPSAPAFSPEGLFFFNIQPINQMFYIFGLALTALPALDLVASKFKPSYSALVRYGFITEIMGGIILITTTDTQVLYIIGWVMGAAYLALWSTLLFSRNAWKNAD